MHPYLNTGARWFHTPLQVLTPLFKVEFFVVIDVSMHQSLLDIHDLVTLEVHLFQHLVVSLKTTSRNVTQSTNTHAALVNKSEMVVMNERALITVEATGIVLNTVFVASSVLTGGPQQDDDQQYHTVDTSSGRYAFSTTKREFTHQTQKPPLYLLEVVRHLKLVLLVRYVGLHFGVGVVDDGQEHVEEHEEHEKDVQDEVHRAQDAVCRFQLVEVEVTQDDTEQRESAIFRSTSTLGYMRKESTFSA